MHDAKARYRVSLPMCVRCAPMQVTKGGSTKVTPGLADEVFWIVTTKSAMGKYDDVLLCNGGQLRDNATWVWQIRAIGALPPALLQPSEECDTLSFDLQI